MCVCLYVIIHACVDACVYACMWVCMYVCMYVFMYACMDVCLHGCKYVSGMCGRVDARVSTDIGGQSAFGTERRNEGVNRMSWLHSLPRPEL